MSSTASWVAAKVEAARYTDDATGPETVPIAEAMVAIVLMDHYLRHRAQNAEVHSATPVIPAAKP